MSSYFTDQRRIATYALDFDTADAEAVLSAVSGPLDVYRVFIQITEDASGSASTVTLGTRLATVVPGGDVSTSYGTVTLPETVNAGDMFVINVAGVDTDLLTTDGGGVSQPAATGVGREVGRRSNQPGAIEVNPGESFVVQSDGTITGANSIVHIEYVQMVGLNTRGDIATVTELAFTRA